MNSSKTAPKAESARHWINGEWVGSSTVQAVEGARKPLDPFGEN
jgi:hypothetical protein